MNNKFENLKKYLNELNEQGICLAFSGGIDSTLLLYLCREMNITAVTFKSIFQTAEEIESTRNLCKKYRVKQEILEFYPLENNILQNNPQDRCYHCKKLIFTGLRDIADGRIILDGTNFDDLSVYRPGLKALKECGVISPLAKFEITKQEIRDYAKICGIDIYNKPSNHCLATRFSYGEKLTPEKLDIVEKCEKILKDYGFENCRLRLHGEIARIEIPPERFSELLSIKQHIIPALKNNGTKYITLDLEGFRSGSMDANPASI